MAESRQASPLSPNGDNTFGPVGAVRVMVWNVRNLTRDRWDISAPPEPVEIDARAQAIAQVIRRSEAHLSILLETGGDAVQIMEKAFGHGSPYRVQSTGGTGGPNDGGERPHQNETYTLVALADPGSDPIGTSIAGAKIALVDKPQYHHPREAEGAREPARVELVRSGAVMATIYAVHAPSPRRKSTIPYLKWAARCLAKEGGLTRILCGDFNVTPDQIEPDLKRHEYRPVFAGPKTTVAAWASWRLLGENFASQAYDQVWALGDRGARPIPLETVMGWVAEAASSLPIAPAERNWMAAMNLLRVSRRLFIAAGGTDAEWVALFQADESEPASYEDDSYCSDDDPSVHSADMESYDSEDEPEPVIEAMTQEERNRRALIEVRSVARLVKRLFTNEIEAVQSGAVLVQRGPVTDGLEDIEKLRDECERCLRQIYPPVIRKVLRVDANDPWVRAVYVSDHIPVVFEIGADGRTSAIRPLLDDEGESAASSKRLRLANQRRTPADVDRPTQRPPGTR